MSPGNASATLSAGSITCTVEVDLHDALGNATAVAFDVVIQASCVCANDNRKYM
jgi:hypothetical protein